MQEVTELCRICRKRPALTQEHIPPKSMGNIAATEATSLDFGQGVRRVAEIFDEGYYLRVLCQKCNNRYGSLYNTSYSQFIRQIRLASGIKDPDGRVLISLQGVFPLRVIKQMFVMYLCIQTRHGWPEIRDSIRKKNEPIPASAPYVFLYKNMSSQGRISPMVGLGEAYTGRQPLIISEISYPAIGIVFCDKRDSRFSDMYDLSEWGLYKYGNQIDTVIRLPELEISTLHPLGFGTEEQVTQWIEKAGVALFVAIPREDSAVTSAVTVLRPKN
jgi:hypothetical protein